MGTLHQLCFIQMYWDITKSLKMKQHKKRAVSLLYPLPILFPLWKGCIVSKEKARQSREQRLLIAQDNIVTFLTLFTFPTRKGGFFWDLGSRQRLALRLVGLWCGRTGYLWAKYEEKRHHFLEPFNAEWRITITILCINLTYSPCCFSSHWMECKYFLNLWLILTNAYTSALSNRDTSSLDCCTIT